MPFTSLNALALRLLAVGLVVFVSIVPAYLGLSALFYFVTGAVFKNDSEAKSRLEAALFAGKPAVEIATLSDGDWENFCIVGAYASQFHKLTNIKEKERRFYDAVLFDLRIRGQTWFLSDGEWGFVFRGENYLEYAYLLRSTIDFGHINADKYHYKCWSKSEVATNSLKFIRDEKDSALQNTISLRLHPTEESR